MNRHHHFLDCRSNQLPIFQIIGLDEPQHRVTKRKRILSIVKTPCHFVQVGLQMLCTDPMPCSHDPALEQGKRGFYAICVDVAIHVHTITVQDFPVLVLRHSGLIQGEGIGRELICDDHIHMAADIFLDVLRQRAALCIFSVEETQIAAALPDSNDNFLGFFASVDTPSDFLSADIGFIHFDRAIQFLKRRHLGHRVADSVAEIPCCPVVDAQHPFKLVRAHSLARLAKQVRRKEPFRERQVRVMEDRASRDGELIAA